MQLDTYYRIKLARSISDYAQDASDGILPNIKANIGNVLDSTVLWHNKKEPSLASRFRGRRNTGLALALGYGNDTSDAKFRQLAAIGTIGAGTVGGGALGLLGGRYLADSSGLTADSDNLRRLGRYALMTGGTLYGAHLGGNLAAAGAGFYVPTYEHTRDISRRMAESSYKSNRKKINNNSNTTFIDKWIENFKNDLGSSIGEGANNIRRGQAAYNREYNKGAMDRLNVPLSLGKDLAREYSDKKKGKDVVRVK